MRYAFLAAATVLLAVPVVAGGDIPEALNRLGIVTDGLLELGEEMLGDPISGNLVLGDTVTVEMVLSADYSYHLHIWTDSSFNIVSFWITAPGGSMESYTRGDHASLVVFPDRDGESTVHMVLSEGWDSDTVGYAAAMFRYRRQVTSMAADPLR